MHEMTFYGTGQMVARGEARRAPAEQQLSPTGAEIQRKSGYFSVIQVKNHTQEKGNLET